MSKEGGKALMEVAFASSIAFNLEEGPGIGLGLGLGSGSGLGVRVLG